MKLRRYLLLSMLGLAGTMTGCKKAEQRDPRTLPDLVRLVTAQPSSGMSQSFTGIVTARIQSDLGFRVAGKVTKRLVDVGQQVHAGQALMTIDITDFTHAITTQTENVASAKARADQAAADEARYKGLVATGAIAASTYDQIKATADAARAQLAAAEAQERIAKDQGDYSLLVADSDGTVVETLAEAGQVVAAGQTVVKLAHSGPREAAIYLPETIRPSLGSEARAAVYGDEQSLPAKLRQLSDSSDLSTRTFEARYVLTGAQATAPLGATVTVQLAPSGSSQLIAVPNAAVTDPGSGPGVFVFQKNDSTVKFRPVVIARLGEEEAYLGSGVRPGEEVVALGAHLLSDGEHVRVLEKETASR